MCYYANMICILAYSGDGKESILNLVLFPMGVVKAAMDVH